MLASLSKKLTEEFDIVGVVGRNPSKISDLETHSPKIIGIAVDYSDEASFVDQLNHFVGIHGKPQLVVSWIHSTSPEAPLIVANYCDGDFYDITGHSGALTDHISREREKTIQTTGVTYHRVILGRNGNRWLTNQEISDGVYQAIQLGNAEFVVGEP